MVDKEEKTTEPGAATPPLAPEVTPIAPTPPAAQAFAPAPVNPASVHPASGLAIAAMIVGIVAALSGFIIIWGVLVGAAAIVLAILALKKPGSKGMAIAGLITGGIGALTSLVFTVLFIVGLAIGGSALKTAVDDANNSGLTATQEDPSVNAKKDFAKGETAVFDTYQVKVNSVQDYTPTASDIPPASGKKYIVINMTVKNIGKESEFAEPGFGVEDGGFSVSAQPVDKLDGAFPADAMLAVGGSITGSEVFEVSPNPVDLSLTYSASVIDTTTGSDTQVSYKLAL